MNDIRACKLISGEGVIV